MAKSLPETEKEMLEIPHVTKANFEKYGEALLDVTQGYAAQKLGILMFFSHPQETTVILILCSII